MSPRQIRLSLFILIVVAFALRVGTVIAFHRWSEPNAIEHRALALSLIQYGTFYFRDFNYFGPSSVQSPPYPMLLATLFKIFGPDSNHAYLAAMIINSVAGAITVWFTYLFVQSIGGAPITALIAAALVTFWPSQIYSTWHVQAVAIITCAMVALFYFFQRAVSTANLAPWIGYSIVGCLGALTEPVLLPILALSGLLILIWKSPLNFTQRIRNAAVLFAAAVLFIVPWMIRNHTVHGQWIPIKSTFWVNVWKGNNPNATGTDRLEMADTTKSKLSLTEVTDTMSDIPHQYDALTPDQRAQLERQPEAAREKIFKQFATTWISANHDKYLKLCAKRLGMTLLFDLDNPKARNIIWISTRILLIPFTLVGLIFAIKQRWNILFPLLVWGSALLTYTLTVTANRFALPFEPLQLALTALVITTYFTKNSAPQNHTDESA
jgi:4-amino-4-deoxy-L-arabinose transferase-like glycosyltransferase